MIRLLRLPILLYRWLVSPMIGPCCRYLPTCSDYALDALDRHGPWRGGWLALRRVARCHPWGGAGLDPVPDDATGRGPAGPRAGAARAPILH